jgi:hypothetical protein
LTAHLSSSQRPQPPNSHTACGAFGFRSSIVELLVDDIYKLGRRKPFVIVTSLLMVVAMLAPMMSPTLPAMFENSADRDPGVAARATNVGRALGLIPAAHVMGLSGSYLLVWPVDTALAALGRCRSLP